MLHEIKVVFNILVDFLCVCVCVLLEIKYWFLMVWLINRFKELMQTLVDRNANSDRNANFAF